jgi:hypothetical protein
VSTFNGGTNSFHMNPASPEAGTTLIASWTDGQPLVGERAAPGSGQIVGLNMFPPSSDARADFWTSSTDGSRLIANTLLFAAGPIMSLPGDIEVPADGLTGATVTYSATAEDADGNAVPVTCTPPSGSTFPIGTTTVRCTAVDTDQTFNEKRFTVTVVPDTTPPVITAVTPSTSVLWPPNHQMETVSFTVSATDDVSTSVSCHIVSVSSNEPVNGTGDGNTAPDWTFSGLTAQLRAERAGNGNGRRYTVTVTCTDTAGNASTATAVVSVPKSQKK